MITLQKKLVCFLICITLRANVISVDTTSRTLGNNHLVDGYVEYNNQPINDEKLKIIHGVKSNIDYDISNDENRNVNKRYLRYQLNQKESEYVRQSKGGNEQKDNKIFIRSGINNVFDQQSQQKILCDIATSLPAVLSFPTNKWNCSSASTDTQICLWRGVTCDINKSIISLSVQSTSVGVTLTSTIPSSISQLINLQKLILKTCLLRGTIPSILSTLKYLNLINLSNNLLSGTIPKSFGELTLLKTLYLSNNSIEGTVPYNLANLSSLSYLDLSMNKLSGKFPVFYGMVNTDLASTIISVSDYDEKLIFDKKLSPKISKYINRGSDRGREGRGRIEMERDMSIVDRARQNKNLRTQNDNWETDNDDRSKSQEKKNVNEEEYTDEMNYNFNTDKKIKSMKNVLEKETEDSSNLSDDYASYAEFYIEVNEDNNEIEKYNKNENESDSSDGSDDTDVYYEKYFYNYNNDNGKDNNEYEHDNEDRNKIQNEHENEYSNEYDTENKYKNQYNNEFENVNETDNENDDENENQNDNEIENENENENDRELGALQSYYGHTYYSPPVLIPSNIGLKYLSLYANRFTGTLPSSIVGISTLEELHTSYNSLTGRLPSSLGLMSSLQSLSLQWNSFTGTIPSTFGFLKKLITLQLFTNR